MRLILSDSITNYRSCVYFVSECVARFKVNRIRSYLILSQPYSTIFNIFVKTSSN